MRLAGKTVVLLFLLIFISPLYAESPDDSAAAADDQDLLTDTFYDDEILFEGEDLFFFEELFIMENAFSFDYSIEDEEDVFLSEEDTDENLADKELQLTEENFVDEEPSLSEEPFSDEDPFLAEESPMEDEAVDETLLAEENADDEDFLDIDALFFEAPPMVLEAPVFEPRSIDKIFPNFSRSMRIMAKSYEVLRNYFEKGGQPMLVPNPELGIDLFGSVMKKNPSHLIEAMVIVPYDKREYDLLDIYNALGRIRKIKDHPAYIGENEFFVFTESSRIASTRSRKAIADPSPAVTLPFSETMYICLKEVNFGNLFIRGEIDISVYGITYSMTNFTDVRYFLVPVMKAERYITMIYLEPVTEGMLIYSVTGFYLPNFIAEKVNLTPNINRRIEIFIDWITTGLREQDSTPAQ